VYGERTARSIGRTGILLLERGNFGVNIFNFVLAGNYTMGEPSEFGVVLPAESLIMKGCNHDMTELMLAEHVTLRHADPAEVRTQNASALFAACQG
jgi:hypothetical protein